MDVDLLIKLVTGVSVIVGGFWGLTRVMVLQFNRSLDDRFAALETARQEGQRQWYERLQKQENKLEALDRDVRQILIELPREYVTRADYARRETILEGKIDQLSLRIQNWMLGGNNAV